MNKQLDEKITEISLKYKELKKCQFDPIKKAIIGELRKLCSEASILIDNQTVITQQVRKKKQIEDIINKINSIQNDIDMKELINPQIGNGGRFKKFELKEQEKQKVSIENMSKRVARTIIMEEVRSTQLKISNKQIEQIAHKMENNLEVMKEIEMMIHEQGQDVDAVQENIKDAYDKVRQANGQLDEAAKIQHKNRILKIRMGISGFFGAIGMKILGFPGLFLGLFTGFSVSSAAK